MGGSPTQPPQDDGRIYDKHVSLGSIISTAVSVIAALGAAAGVWAAVKSEIAVQGKGIESVEHRVQRLELGRDTDRQELNETLREINSKLADIQVSLATKEDIRNTLKEPDAGRRRP